DNFFAALSLIKVEGRSFFDYVPYKTIGVDATPLWELRYNELTDSGTKSGLVILCKDDRNDDNEIPFGSKFTQIYRYYDETFGDYREQYTPIRSLWLNTNSNAELFDGVDKEAEFIKENWSKYSKMVRVNQSQKTMQLGSAKGFLNTAIDWSLLNAAENLNPKLLAHEGFAERLAVMPIFQVDFVNSSKKDFNNKVNAVILDFNNKLCAA
ncbi:MAG: hypothetical protein LBN25_04435, partial [Christensenellaceae bacterium]|nr:hypothetical protein [Christensenellaceae bacterium]